MYLHQYSEKPPTKFRWRKCVEMLIYNSVFWWILGVTLLVSPFTNKKAMMCLLWNVNIQRSQNWRTLLITAATAGGRAALKRETLEWCFPNVRVIVTVLYRDPGAFNQTIKLIMFTRLRQPSWSTAVAGWSSIRILSPSQWGWSCWLGWCPAQQPDPSLPSHATPDTARNSRHQWPHGSGQWRSL